MKTPLIHILTLLVSAGLACDDGTPPGADASIDSSPDSASDAEVDASNDSGPDGSVEVCEGYDPGRFLFDPDTTALVLGGSRVVRVAVDVPALCALPVSLEVSVAEVIDVPTDVVIAEGERFVDIELVGDALGEVLITARLIAAPLEGEEEERELVTELSAQVVSVELECSGEANGTIGPGQSLEVGGEGELSGTRVTFQDDPELPSIDATISCASDIVEEGYIALGPAVSIAGDVHRFYREVELYLPFWPVLMPPSADRQHLEVFYQGPGQAAPRRVALSNRLVHGGPVRGELEVGAQRFGTFQVAVAQDAGTRTRTRHYTYRGLIGVSMGGGATANIGLRHPELFDFLAPLGGPGSWLFMLDYMSTFHTGGFCPVDPDDPSTLTNRYCDVPSPRQYLEFTQEFEHWFYPDGWSGQGGTFNRRDYCQIFRDLSYAFGNPSFWAGPEQRYYPPGIDESFVTMSDEEKCANPQILTDFHNAEYNPDGSFPVITFCDGNEVDGDVGRWNPDIPPSYPLDIALAVDLNRNGLRDSGEPVIFNGHERYDDVGLDGVPSESEPGFDPQTNPDPSDDDWDYLFNPLGTEGNRRFDLGEPFQDSGLDGVPGTAQLDSGGYDFGEGNGVFDWNPTITDRYFDHDGYNLLLDMDESQLDNIDIIADGGVRDLFVFGPVMQSMMSALLARGRDVHFYNGFAPLQGDLPEDDLDPSLIDYFSTGQNMMVRYGSLDATQDMLEAGDGGHVGTVLQMTNRMLTALFNMSARWPEGDRHRVQWDITSGLNFIDSFTDSHGRTSPYSVVLPPGYFDDDQQHLTYPVVYFLHGYGQRAEDLVATGLLVPSYMISRSIPEPLRMQKFIMIFPDGRCRSDPDPESDLHGDDRCIRGTFYVDSWHEDGPMTETGLLELMQHVDNTFRTRPPADIEERY